MRILAGSILLAMLACSAAMAGNLSVANASFENPSFSAGPVPGQHTDGIGDFWITYVPGWNINADEAGIGTLDNGALTPEATDGSNILFVHEGFVWQTLGVTLQANTSYTLSVDVGQRTDDGPISYYVELLAGNTLLAMDNDSLAPTPGSWLTSNLAFTTGSDPDGLDEPLTIVLGSNAQTTDAYMQTDFDNVQLDPDVPSVPEPGSLLLLGSGVLGVLARRRR